MVVHERMRPIERRYSKIRLKADFKGEVQFLRVIHVEAQGAFTRQDHGLAEDAYPFFAEIIFELLTCRAEYLILEEALAVHFAHHACRHHAFAKSGNVCLLRIAFQGFFKLREVIFLTELYRELIVEIADRFAENGRHTGTVVEFFEKGAKVWDYHARQMIIGFAYADMVAGQCYASAIRNRTWMAIRQRRR